jgi:hypothetical protein
LWRKLVGVNQAEHVQSRKTVQKQAWSAAGYVNVEGSADLGWGTALLCWSVVGYGVRIFHPRSWVHVILWLIFLFGAVSPLLLPRIIRKHITWPRTGCMAYLRDSKFRVIIGLSAVIAAALGFLIPHLLKPEMHQYIAEQIQQTSPKPALEAPARSDGHWGGAVLTLFLVCNPLLYLMMNAVSITRHAWKWLLLILMIAGSVAISVKAPGGFFEVMQPLMLFIGLMWFSSGVGTLSSYIRHNPIPVALA